MAWIHVRVSEEFATELRIQAATAKLTRDAYYKKCFEEGHRRAKIRQNP